MCVFFCLFVNMYVCLCAYVCCYVYAYVWVFVSVYVYMCVLMCVCVSVVYNALSYMCVYVRVRQSVCIRMHIYISICVVFFVSVCVMRDFVCFCQCRLKGFVSVGYKYIFSPFVFVRVSVIVHTHKCRRLSAKFTFCCWMWNLYIALFVVSRVFFLTHIRLVL